MSYEDYGRQMALLHSLLLIRLAGFFFLPWVSRLARGSASDQPTFVGTCGGSISISLVVAARSWRALTKGGTGVSIQEPSNSLSYVEYTLRSRTHIFSRISNRGRSAFRSCSRCHLKASCTNSSERFENKSPLAFLWSRVALLSWLFFKVQPKTTQFVIRQITS